MLITFICSGNTCRSPMAEYILKDKLKNAKIKNIKVQSAGLYAENGAKMSENSSSALKIMGINASGFKSKQLTFEMVEKSDMLICMTSSHKLALKEFTNKAKTIGELTGGNEISDPFGYKIEAYLKTFSDLEVACEILLKNLTKKEK